METCRGDGGGIEAAGAMKMEPECEKCDTAQKPTPLSGGYWFCPCCASVFRWPPRKATTAERGV